MADPTSIDPRKMSTEEFARQFEVANSAMDLSVFARLVKYASTEQLEAVLDDPARRGALLDGIFSRMADQFRAENAPGRDSAIHWHITSGPSDVDVYETWVTGVEGHSAPQCSTSKELSHDPRVTLTMPADQFLALVSGNSSPTMMFITGKMTLDGDIGFAANLPKIFDIPQVT